LYCDFLKFLFLFIFYYYVIHKIPTEQISPIFTWKHHVSRWYSAVNSGWCLKADVSETGFI
jgi:hypothetical protein